MIKIRFQKLGAKNKVFYRIVAINKRKKVTGSYTELLGYYNPGSGEFKIDKDKFSKLIAKGAQISQSVSKLINKK
jgi:small subunit ribosomal protein S16